VEYWIPAGVYTHESGCRNDIRGEGMTDLEEN